MILELENICKNYGHGQVEVPALTDVNLQVEAGEYLAIMGPSGSGKSTLMNILGCLDRATSGTYILEGENISELSDRQLSNVRLNKIGFVFQTFQLLPQETALENVALPLIYAGVPRHERLERAAEALRKVGLDDRKEFLPTQLSGGQKQRVAIARAMINEPTILLADEPTGALDQASGAQVMELFRTINAEGATVIMITHDANVASNARRMVTIVDGRLYDDAAKANEEAARAREAAAKTAEETEKPAEEATKPVEITARPMEEAAKLAEEAAKLAEEAAKLTEAIAIPAEAESVGPQVVDAGEPAMPETAEGGERA